MAGWLPRLFTAALPRARPFQEMGVSGTPVYAGYVLTPERSSKLIGQEKYRTFSEMLANVSIVSAGVRYFLNIVAQPSWSCEAADDSGDEGQQYADFVNDVMQEDLHTPWSRVVRRCGTYRFHGFNIQEWVAKRREDGLIGFHDIESRPQWTIWRWEVDERGTVIGAWQRDPLTGRELGLPRGKLMYLVDDTLTDSPEGMGLLRHCYEPARRLEEYLRQEGLGYLRDLQGIPLGRAPITDLQNAVNAKKMTKAQMDQALQTLQDFVTLERKDRKTGIVLDSQPFLDATESGLTNAATMKWGLELVSGGKPSVEAINSAIVRVNTEIARILGVEHLLLGADAEGSYALAKEKARDLYLLANSVLRDIREQVQHDLLWPLWKLNGFPEEMMPQLKSEDVAPKDVEQISRVMRDMATAGATLAPDDEIQNSIRDLLGMPHVDLEKLAEMYSMGEQQGAAPGQGAAQGGIEDRMDQAMLGGAKPPRAPGSYYTNAGATPAAKRANGFDKAAPWEESKHPRAEHGRFGPGSGSNEKGKTKSNGKDQKSEVSVEQHAAASASVSNFLSNKASVIGGAVKDYLAEHGLTLALETTVNIVMFKLFGRALLNLALGPYGTAVIIAEDLAYTAATQMIEVLSQESNFSAQDAKNLLVETGRSLLGGSKGKVEKAEPTKEEAPKSATGAPEKPSKDGPDMLGLLKTLLQALEAVKDSDLQQNQQQQQPQPQPGQKPQKPPVKKMVPYKEARPYREEDTSFHSRAGAADGAMSDKVEDTFDSRGGIQGHKQGPYGSMRGTGDQDPPLNLGDDPVPGSRLQTRGRRRIIP